MTFASVSPISTALLSGAMGCTSRWCTAPSHMKSGCQARLASVGALRTLAHQPVRILSVTGTPCGWQALTTACTISMASASSCMSAEPAHLLQTFLAGQPMLMSMICAPRSML